MFEFWDFKHLIQQLIIPNLFDWFLPYIYLSIFHILLFDYTKSQLKQYDCQDTH